jgi:hypothetical protein
MRALHTHCVSAAPLDNTRHTIEQRRQAGGVFGQRRISLRPTELHCRFSSRTHHNTSKKLRPLHQYFVRHAFRSFLLKKMSLFRVKMMQYQRVDVEYQSSINIETLRMTLC